MAQQRENYLGPEAQKDARAHIREEMGYSPSKTDINERKKYLLAQEKAHELLAQKIKEYPELAGVKKQPDPRNLKKLSTMKFSSAE